MPDTAVGAEERASMLGDPRSHGLWEKTAPAAPPATALTGDHTADAVVVGGGYTGLSTALHLAEAGVGVILLEAAEIGFGGAGGNEIGRASCRGSEWSDV